MESEWLYCTVCERAFQANLKTCCGYSRCEGSLGDIWGWEVILDLNHDYPKIPTKGEEYPLFREKSQNNANRKAG